MAPGAGLRLGRRLPPLERDGVRLGAGPLGAPPRAGRRLGAGALEEHAPRLGVDERALALIPAADRAHQVMSPSFACFSKNFSTSAGVASP